MNRLFIILLTLFLGSCDSWLDVKPENQVTFTNYFEDEKDVEGAVLQLFAAESVFLAGENDWQKWVGILADEWSSTYMAPRLFQASLLSTWQSNWTNLYKIVYLANTILENGPRASMDNDRMDFWLGQAYFVKGIGYFQIARTYGDAVITKNSTSLEAYGRSPMLEVIDTAIVNALNAYRLLPEFENLKDLSGSAISSKQYAGKGAAAALLAHLYAWRGSVTELFELEGDATADYQKSIDYSTEIIDQKVGFYELQPNPETLCEVMSSMGEYNKESIFEIELNPSETYAKPMHVLGYFLTGYPINVNETYATQNTKSFRLKWTTVLSMYEENDERLAAYFYEDENIINNRVTYPNAYLKKWREGFYYTTSGGTTTRMSALRANQVEWRLAEIYLLRAECRVKLGTTGAEDDLNEVRKRANATPYPAAGEHDLKLAVFKEREKELLYENHRFSDVMRNGIEYIQQYFGYSYTDGTEVQESYLKYVTKQDLKDGILFQPVPKSAFEMNTLMRQTAFWMRYVKY